MTENKTTILSTEDKNKLVGKARSISACCENAMQYALRGFYVFPCKKKVPLTQRGFKDASMDPQQVLDWWQENPNASIGLPTGAKNGITVLDLDICKDTKEKLGEKTLKNAGLGAFIDGPGVTTPSGGKHLYFHYSLGVGCSTNTLKNAQKIATGVDVRSDGGYVIAPFSEGYLPNDRLLTWLRRGRTTQS